MEEIKDSTNIKYTSNLDQKLSDSQIPAPPPLPQFGPPPPPDNHPPQNSEQNIISPISPKGNKGPKFVFFTILFILIAGTFAYAQYSRLSSQNNNLLQDDALQENTGPLFRITKSTADYLNQNFVEGGKEFSACIFALQDQEYANDSLYLETKYTLNKIDNQGQSSGYDYSNQGYCEQGVIHTHPAGNCVFSVADIYSFKDRIKKGEIFSVLMCGKDKFYYITRNDFTEKVLDII